VHAKRQQSPVCVVGPQHERILLDGCYYSVDAVRQALRERLEVGRALRRSLRRAPLGKAGSDDAAA
jgi:hypothetical protein